jgi:hypothetical protein
VRSCPGFEVQTPQTKITSLPVASAVHSEIRESFTITVGQNDDDDVAQTCLEHEVKDCSHKACRNYDNSCCEGQEREYADENEAGLQREMEIKR